MMEQSIDQSSSESGEILFYLDYISHNVYVAWHALLPLAEKHERVVTPVPVLFAGLLNAHGSVGPAEVPAKARWMMRDVLRKALDLGLPLAPPASHPFRPLLPLRVTGVVSEPRDRARVVTELLAATWAKSLDVSKPSVVTEVLDGLGLDGGAIVEQAGYPEAKERLRRDTDQAIADGVFGVPSMRVDGRLFWGYDDLVNLDRYLAGDDPVESHSLPSWKNVKPSAQRRRPSD